MSKAETRETMRLLGADLNNDRPALDFYETPENAVRGLLQKESFKGLSWDPASGNGAITKFFPNMFASDIRMDNKVVGKRGVDFLKLGLQDLLKDGLIVDNIVVNPPFSLALEFALQSIKFASKKIALFQKIQFLEGRKRREQLFKVNPPNRVWVFVDRQSCPDGIHNSGKGGMMCFAWYVWEKFSMYQKGDLKTRIGWID